MAEAVTFTLPPAIKSAVFALYRAIVGAVARDRFMVWPPVASQEQLDDLLPRLRFYFADGERVVVPLATAAIAPSPGQPWYFGEQPERCTFEFPVVGASRASALGKALGNRGVLIAGPCSGSGWLRFLPNVSPIGPHEVDMETLWVAKLWQGGVADALRESRTRFEAWRRGLPKKKKAYLLCTGPSLSRYAEFDMSDGYVIGCNTVVKNADLMQRTAPAAVVASDPIYFFGPSTYAARFREDLRGAMAAYPFLFLTAAPYHHLLGRLFPDFAQRMVFVGEHLRAPAARLTETWQMPKTPNILTNMMLPLAWTLADEIYIVGADGRDPKDTYFWKHDPSSQNADKLAAMKACHPQFFVRVDYAKYYEAHCAILRRQVEYMETRGARIRALTPSFVPVLAERPAG